MMRELAGATRSMTCRSWFTEVDLPTILLTEPDRTLRSLTSRFSREFSSARSAMSTRRSALNGFSMKS